MICNLSGSPGTLGGWHRIEQTHRTNHSVQNFRARIRQFIRLHAWLRTLPHALSPGWCPGICRFHDRRFADIGFQAGVVDTTQFATRIDREISFASDPLGKEIGEGIGRVVGMPSGRVPGTELPSRSSVWPTTT
jgi:hypothetical protein